RKRHRLVDTPGFLLQPVVHPADVADRDGGKLVLLRLQPWEERFPRRTASVVGECLSGEVRGVGESDLWLEGGGSQATSGPGCATSGGRLGRSRRRCPAVFMSCRIAGS